MKFTSLTLVTLVSYAIAAPTAGGCLSLQAGTDLVNRYAAIVGARDSDIGGPVETAEQIIADTYNEFSDSANQQIGLPVRISNPPHCCCNR